MASTDTRSGFRLPWSSDRSHEDPTPEAAAEGATQEGDAPARGSDLAWPETDISAALGVTKEQRPADPDHQPAVPAEEPDPMVDMDTAVAPAPARPPKKSSKLMADLTAAIRATAEHAREQALAQVETDVQQVVEAIRAASADGAVALKHQSDEDIASIREWSKAEIARIREETEARITSRKSTLEEELAGHAAAVERRVEEVQAEVRRFEQEMDAYLERLATEQDPARLATMAEEMPEAPSLEGWTDLGTLDVGSNLDEIVDHSTDQPASATAEPVATIEDPAAAEEPVTAAGWDAAESEADQAAGNDGWAHETNAWNPDAQGVVEDPASDEAAATDPDGGDSPRWAAGETPDGFPGADAAEGGDPVDRGAIMAALEAAAEAVVAAEAAAESADQAEAAADVAETAAELLVGRSGAEDELDPEAEAALNARVEAGGYETSFADRLASLLPGHGEGAVGDEQRTTQVVVSGLVSVASIASFKRHLARVSGVQNVAVASGPEGEFLFSLTHRADLSFRDAIPTMPGFAARVTSAGDGVVHVTARDPEAEG